MLDVRIPQFEEKCLMSSRRTLQALGVDEVAPGVSFSELSGRRDALAALLPTGAVCVLPSAPHQTRVGTIPHPYRQNADFLYLTGLQQEGVAVFHKLSESSALSHRVRTGCGVCEFWALQRFHPTSKVQIWKPKLHT